MSRLVAVVAYVAALVKAFGWYFDPSVRVAVGFVAAGLLAELLATAEPAKLSP